ncbi:MAG: sulfurtransferase TusA [endosymbiont of Galathealinum brachiosum]|uniref:Sulfurtransferase TusA n=1 Tax=endosymbiont of Galathealinum brachiosum TaxID=2200906 RepID=A0A370DF32_9GAMM|nr:MAG: sulfurtransferase TusA [endosymbiont of Galathealinum brachiosum]
MKMNESDDSLDVCGMCCPMPLISLSKSAGSLEAGKTLRIIGDDPIFEQGVRDFCELNQHEILSVKPQVGRMIEIIIKISESEE